MDKLEVQQRVLQNGKPLDLDKFSWDENTNTFSSNEGYLVLDFKDVIIITTQCANTILKPAFDIAGYKFKSKISFLNASQSVAYLLSDAMDYFMLRK